MTQYISPISTQILRPFLGRQYGQKFNEQMKKLGTDMIARLNRACQVDPENALAAVFQHGITYSVEELSMAELAEAFQDSTKMQFAPNENKITSLVFDKEYGLINNLLLNPPVILRDGDEITLISARHRMLGLFGIQTFLHSLTWEERESMKISCIVYTVDRKALSQRFPESFESKLMRYKAALILAANGGKGVLASRESTQAESEAIVESSIGVVAGDTLSYVKAAIRYDVTRESDLKFTSESIWVRLLKDRLASRLLPKSVNGTVLPDTASPALKSNKMGDEVTRKATYEFSPNSAWTLKAFKALYKVFNDRVFFAEKSLPGKAKKEKDAQGVTHTVMEHPSKYKYMLEARVAYLKAGKLHQEKPQSVPRQNDFDPLDYGYDLSGQEFLVDELFKERSAAYWLDLRKQADQQKETYEWVTKVPAPLFAAYEGFNFFDVAAEVTLESPVMNEKSGALVPVQISRYREKVLVQVFEDLLVLMNIPATPLEEQNEEQQEEDDDTNYGDVPELEMDWSGWDG